MKQTISETVDKWLEENNNSKGRRVTGIRKSSPWYGMSEEEIEDRIEYEYVEIPSVLQVAEILSVMILKWCRFE